MKIRKISKNVFGIIILFALFGISIAVVQSDDANAASAQCVTIKTGKTYQTYDITNDGKADTIRTETVGGEDYCETNFEVYVNGNKALDIKSDYFKGGERCQLLSLANGKKYLYIYLGYENDDGPVSLYKYKNGKLVKEIDLIKRFNKVMGYHAGASVKRVSGNRIIFKMYSMSIGLASVHFEVAYQYKGNKLVLTSKTHKILNYYTGGTGLKIGVLTASRPIQLYHDKTAKKKAKKISKGTKLKATKCYISGKKVTFYVKTEDGTDGWFVSPKSTLNKPFDEIVYAG